MPVSPISAPRANLHRAINPTSDLFPSPSPRGVCIYIYIYILARRKDAAEAFIKGVNAARAIYFYSRDISTAWLCVCVCVAFFVACSSFHYVFFDRGNFATFVPVSRVLFVLVLTKCLREKKTTVLYTRRLYTHVRHRVAIKVFND